MEYKNVYVFAHGMRIKDNYFALEPNVRVYTNCSDSITWFNPFANLLKMKYLLNNNSKISDYKNIIKIYNKYLNNIYKDIKNINMLIKEIKDKELEQIHNAKKDANSKLEKIEKEIKTIDKIIEKISEKNSQKYKSILKKSIKLKNKKIYIINNIKSYIKGDFEKLKIFNKPFYDKIKKYTNLYNKYNKQKRYIEYAFQHQYGLKKDSFNYYNGSFNPCVFSGNLNNRIRKYIKNMALKDLLDLHICPNVTISQEYNNNFRDFVSEFPINIEIRNSTNKVIANKEEIQILINKYIQKTLEKNKYNLQYLFNNDHYTLEQLINNRILITTLINFTKKYEAIHTIMIEKKEKELDDMEENFKKTKNLIEEIKTFINNYETEHYNNIPLESDYNRIITKCNVHIREINNKIESSNYTEEEKKIFNKEIKEIYSTIHYIHSKKSVKEKIGEREIIESEITIMKKLIHRMNEEYKTVINDKYKFYVNKSKNELFYPLQDWGDCNISTPFGSILSEYIKKYLENYDVESKDILFRYYDIRKGKYLDEKECYQKHKEDYSKYKKADALSFNLRDLLIYLYNYYGLNENKNLKLDVDISGLCLSEFTKPNKIYKTTRLNVNDYCTKLYKIDGKMTTLRDYDNNVSNNDKVIEEKVKGRRIKKSCSLYRVADGCPSHCDLPSDLKRRTCVVKGRKKEYIRKVGNP